MSISDVEATQDVTTDGAQPFSGGDGLCVEVTGFPFIKDEQTPVFCFKVEESEFDRLFPERSTKFKRNCRSQAERYLPGNIEYNVFPGELMLLLGVEPGDRVKVTLSVEPA